MVQVPAVLMDGTVAWMNVDKQDDNGSLSDIAGNYLGDNDYNLMEGARITGGC